MKFGDSLRQHSVPEWAYYNVDYDAVKQLIKESTSIGKGKAIDIPGQGDDASAAAEKRLFGVLVSEHDRVALFVKSKRNEIEGRLGNLERTLKKLGVRQSGLDNTTPRPYILQRYARLEHEAISTGEEIRSLSRFIVAQKTAFRKLLKKYAKWSDSTALRERFQIEVLNKSESFTHVSLADTFDRWTALLQAIRASKSPATASNGPIPRPESLASARKDLHEHPQTSSAAVAQQFEQVLASTSDVNFDTAFSEASIGDAGQRAVYWVHPEQLIELQVLLLQHLRLYITRTTLGTPASLSQSPASITRRSSLSARNDSLLERDTDTGVICLDDAEEYGLQQRRLTVGDAEGRLNEAARAAALARWTNINDDATLAFHRRAAGGGLTLSKVRRKHLGALLDVDRDFQPWKNYSHDLSSDLKGFGYSVTSISEARDLLVKEKGVHPLAAVLSKRTRLHGLGNSSRSGQWVTLDANVTICGVAKEDLAGKDWVANLARDGKEFPFAILRVRQEGKVAKDLIDILDKSHLTERVRGFSLTSHAIWDCCRPKTMSPPFWLGAMSRDIRKVPENVTLGRRKSSQVTITQHANGSSASSSSGNDRSGSSTAVAADSSATSVPGTPAEEPEPNGSLSPILERKPKRVTLDAAAFDKPSRRKRKDEVRYWNEYDNPDSEDDSGAYYIYIDPNKDERWFGQDAAEKLYSRLHSLFGKKEKIADEERPLLRALTDNEDDPLSSPTDSENESPARTSFFSRKKKRVGNGYGSVSQRSHGVTSQSGRPSTRLSDIILPPVETEVSPSTSARLLISALSLGASVILCIMISILAATGRRKQIGEVDAGILFGVIASLFFALVGLTSVLTSREPIGLTNWLAISVVFCAVCLADGVLVGWVLV